MQRPVVLAAVGAVAAGSALAGAGALWYERPTHLTVAVSQKDEADRALIEAAAALLKRSRNAARLDVRAVDDPAAASAAVDDGKADLAVIRTDVAIPDNAQTVVILHRDAAILLAPSSSGIKAVADLPGHAVGVVRLGSGNRGLLATVLQEADLKPDSVTLVPLKPDEVGAALRDKRVSAVMAVDVVSSPALRDLVRLVASLDPPAAPDIAAPVSAKPAGRGAIARTASQTRGKPRAKVERKADEDDASDADPSVPGLAFVPVREADAISQRSPAYEKVAVPRGMFGGTPPRPAANYDTLSITHRLVANENVSQSLVSELTRFFLVEKGPLTAGAPIAMRIEAPNTDKGAALPVHAGSAAYIDDDEQTFFDKYSDFIYIGAMLIGVLASGVTAVMGRLSRAQPAAEEALYRLVALVASARTAASGAELDAVQAEADGLMARFLAGPSRTGDEGRLSAFGLALGQVRTAVRDRRAQLALLPVHAEVVTMASAAE